MPLSFWIITCLLVVWILGAALLRFRRTRKKTIVEAIIDIYPSGSHHIEFVPARGINSMDAIQLAISYLSNTLFVTSGDSLKLDGPLICLFDYISHWTGNELPSPEAYRDGLSKLAVTSRVDPFGDGRFAVREGERYRGKLIRGIQMDYSLSNFSVYGHNNNLSYSALLLYCQIAHKLDDTHLQLLHLSFVGLVAFFFDKKITILSNQILAFIIVECALQAFPEPIRNNPDRAKKNSVLQDLQGR